MEEDCKEKAFRKYIEKKAELGESVNGLREWKAFCEGFHAGRMAFLEEPLDYMVPAVYVIEKEEQNIALRKELEELKKGER